MPTFKVRDHTSTTSKLILILILLTQLLALNQLTLQQFKSVNLAQHMLPKILTTIHSQVLETTILTTFKEASPQAEDTFKDKLN